MLWADSRLYRQLPRNHRRASGVNRPRRPTEHRAINVSGFTQGPWRPQAGVSGTKSVEGTAPWESWRDDDPLVSARATDFSISINLNKIGPGFRMSPDSVR